MKKSIFGKIGAAAVVLTLVTSSLVGGTFAKYTSSVNANAMATVAKWSIKFDDADKSISNSKDIVLANTNDNAKTATGTIGPESSGKIVITVDGSGAEVGYTYKILADTADLKGIPVTFYKTAADRDSNKAIDPISEGSTKFVVGEGSVPYGSENMKPEVELFWKWSSESSDADNALGEAETAINGLIGLTMTAEQITESAETPVAP